MREHLIAQCRATVRLVCNRIQRWTRPTTRLDVGYVRDHFRSRAELIWENALLRKQLEVAYRQVTRPRLTWADRVTLVLLARRAPTWHSATLLVQPAMILRWHQQGFRFFWRRTSKRTGAPPRIAADTIALIERVARNNRLWGAERIRGELLKLGIRVAKRTIQKHMRRIRARSAAFTSRSTAVLTTHCARASGR